MKTSTIPVEFPIHGLVQNVAYAKQPPLTSQSALNIRSYDPLLGRNRGGQRSGLSKYCPTQISGANPGQCLTANVYVTNSPTLSQKVVNLIAVSQGNVKLFNTTGTLNPVNFSGALSSTQVPIWAGQLGNFTYFMDGVNWKYYDPTTGTNGTVQTLSASAGSLPTDSSTTNAPRLMAIWRGRLVVAGLPLDPNNWFMSRVYDPTDWAYNPSPSTETQPVAGNDGGVGDLVGLAPDLVNALVPYSNEILIFGGARSIHQMTGDPMSGGRFDLVSDGIGMGWGRPFCRDGQGILYFFSAAGSIYQFIPGALPQRISDPITYLTQSTDTSRNVVTMLWDEFEHGFHVWVTPVGAAATALHFFWDQVNGAWLVDQYANNNFNPLCCMLNIGDTPLDRTPLVMGFDGYVRRIDYTAKDDDGVAIQSNVSIGPLPMGYITDIQCDLDINSGPITWTLYSGAAASDIAQSTTPPGMGRLQTSGIFYPGRNPSQPVKQFGHAHYLTLSGPGAVKSSWQFEAIQAVLQVPDGMTRQRIF